MNLCWISESKLKENTQIDNNDLLVVDKSVTLLFETCLR